MIRPNKNKCYVGDCLTIMRRWPAQCVQMCVTSPPYFGLRDFGVEGQIGLEVTIEEYVDKLVAVFREVRRVLRDDGTLWLVLGDGYAQNGIPGRSNLAALGEKHRGGGHKRDEVIKPRKTVPGGLRPKDLLGIPWRVAFALQADGWWLRQDIIWAKRNPMPESVKDRCTKAHEYVFLLAKAEHYFFDQAAIMEPCSADTHARYARGRSDHHKWADGGPGRQTIVVSYDHMKKPSGRQDCDIGVGHNARPRKAVPNGAGKIKNNESFDAAMAVMPGMRNKRDVWQEPIISDDRKPLRSDIECRHRSRIPGGQSLQAEPTGRRNRRSVWSIATSPYSGAHFACFPPALVEPCILAGSRPGDIVLDPFMGSGTTARVAQQLGRNWLGCELNPAYLALIRQRLAQAG